MVALVTDDLFAARLSGIPSRFEQARGCILWSHFHADGVFMTGLLAMYLFAAAQQRDFNDRLASRTSFTR